jgi:type IV secretion system protein TrbG
LLHIQFGSTRVSVASGLLGSAVVVMACGCAGRHPAPDIPLGRAMKAQPIPDPARPVQIVEIAQPLPLPGQLKPAPDRGADPKETAQSAGNPGSEGGQQLVTQANAAARVQPTRPGFVNAMQVWPYSPGALYQVYTSPGRITDIALQPGEDLRDISAPDTVRWVIGDTESGQGSNRCVHIAVKPTRVGLQSNLAIYTSLRTYFLELTSTPETWMASVAWDYPQDRLLALKNANRERDAAAPVAENIPIQNLQFRYVITGDSPSWRPDRAFDDGAHVYIQFPPGIAQGEMPPLFIIGAEGDAQLVNYRVRSPYYIVDRLFGAAELRIGGVRSQTVRIARSDIAEPTRSRKSR